MRVLVLEDLTKEEIDNIRQYLDNFTEQGPIEDLFWYILPEEVLTKKQKQLNKEKGPYKLSIEVGKTSIRFELIIRADMIHNDGGGLVTQEQMLHVYQMIDTMVKDLKLVTCA
jgi:hypothetical protein